MRKTLWFPIGALLLGLYACQNVPQTANYQEVVGVLGGAPTRPTLMGQPLDLQGGSLSKEGRPYAGPLLPGMVVRATASSEGGSLRAQSVDIQVALKGPIEAIDLGAGTLTVLGQTVQTDANTQIYMKVGGTHQTLLLSDLKVGEGVEVHGSLGGGILLASYIEVLPSGRDEVKLEGRASSLDTNARTFVLAGYTVDYSGARIKGTPQEEAWVEVEGLLQGTTIQATEVSFKTPGNSGYGASRRVELEGPVSGLDMAAKTFFLLDYQVDYSQVRVVGTLTDGAYVEVKGQVDPQSPSQLQAQVVKVKYPKTPPAKAEVKGRVEGVSPSDQTFSVGGLGFYVDGTTLLKREGPDGPLAFSDLRAGDWVEVRYDPSRVVNGYYHALKVKLKGNEDQWKGVVSGIDRNQYTFQLLGYTVQTTLGTEFRWQDTTYRRDQFFNVLQEGDRVEVEATLSGSTLLATKVKLKRR